MAGVREEHVSGRADNDIGEPQGFLQRVAPFLRYAPSTGHKCGKKQKK